MINLIILFLIIAITPFIFLLPTILLSSCLISTDSYYWTAAIMYLVQTGNNKYSWLYYDYPYGFCIIIGFFLIFSPDKKFIYYFMKFSCLPFFSVYLFFIAVILKKITKEKIIIYTSLILTLSYNFLLQRIIAFYPSILANIIILSVFLVIDSKVSNYFFGIIIPCSFLIHPLSTLFLLISLIIYYVWKLVNIIYSKQKLINLIKEIIGISIISIIFLIPYFIILYFIFNVNLINLTITYINKLIFILPENLIYKGFNERIQLSLYNINFFEIFKFNILNEIFFYRTIGWFLFFGIIGVFIKYKGKTELEDLIFFIKIGFILIFIIFYFPYLLNLDFLDKNESFNFGKYRIFETFCPNVILLTAFSFNYILKRLRILWSNFLNKYNKIQFFFKNSKRKESIFNFGFLFLLLILTGAIIYR
ncbi:MAG: hypothetical protein ACP6IY_21555, partial [Promethearchaeia archaeon]